MAADTLFIVAQTDKPNLLLLDDREAHHAKNVLRIREGDSLRVTDGHGNGWEATLLQWDKNHGLVEPQCKIHSALKPLNLHLFVAPPKSQDRLEWLVEKATEMGLIHLHCIRCRRSERKHINLSRLNTIAASAMKQSGRFHLPTLYEMVDFEQALKNTNNPMKSGLASCHWQNNQLPDHLTDLMPFTHIYIGPEGDFHEDEMALALAAGISPISLGAARMRTETAALLTVTLTYAHARY
jgi:16S rRNA (uracil1498-N3)-methyltransferase